MREITAEVSRFIEADPKEVYAVLTDYSGGHQAILPKQYFSGLSVNRRWTREWNDNQRKNESDGRQEPLPVSRNRT